MSRRFIRAQPRLRVGSSDSREYEVFTSFLEKDFSEKEIAEISPTFRLSRAEKNASRGTVPRPAPITVTARSRTWPGHLRSNEDGSSFRRRPATRGRQRCIGCAPSTTGNIASRRINRLWEETSNLSASPVDVCGASPRRATTREHPNPNFSPTFDLTHLYSPENQCMCNTHGN